jgi:alpha-L-fucosidase
VWVGVRCLPPAASHTISRSLRPCRGSPGKVLGHKWENAATVDKWSWGYRRNAVYADFLTVPEILTELVSTVACGGNFLVGAVAWEGGGGRRRGAESVHGVPVACAQLNVGPAHDGTIDNIFADRLLGMGQWLGVNGEVSGGMASPCRPISHPVDGVAQAIYSSTPWRAQNDTAASVWYTLGADGAVYAIALVWPADNTLVLTQPIATASVAASLVGSPAAVTVVSNGASGVTVTLPALNPVQLPCQYAWSVRLTGVQ